MTSQKLDENEVPSTGLSLSKLMGLQNLQYEPKRLFDESQRLNNILEELVMENYRIFVDNLSCSIELRAEDENLEELRNSFQDDMSQLSATCSDFRDKVMTFVNSHKRNRKTLQHHMQLIELLEVPQLVDACARNGFFDEALELAHFVNGLERRHLLANEGKSTDNSPRIGNNVVQSIVDDVYKILLSLRVQLLQLLCEESSLPKELQILGILRKLDTLLIDRRLSLERHENDIVSSLNDEQRDLMRKNVLKSAETRLQMDFLEARTIWLQKVTERTLHLSSNPTIISSETNEEGKININEQLKVLGPYGRLLEVLELYRTAWFSIITQFQALFSDQRESTHSSNEILSVWVTKQIQLLIDYMNIYLPFIEDGGSLRSIIEQTSFFASRMREVGCDFLNLVIPLFSHTVIFRVSSEWETAVSQFKIILLTERINIDNDDLSREQVVPLYLSLDESISIDEISGIKVMKKNYDEIAAPNILLEFPPLAFVLNSILSGLNFLRECPLLTINSRLYNLLHNVILQLVDFIVENKKELSQKSLKYSDSSKSSNGKKKIALDNMYAELFCQELLPHILMCFDSIYINTNTKINFENCSIKRINDARDFLSKESFTILQLSWDKFLIAGLLSKDTSIISDGSSMKLHTIKSADKLVSSNAS